MMDNDLMPNGIHKGKKMCNVPADYLLYIHKQGWTPGEVAMYIEENLEVLKQEVKQGVV
jgi:uncharacterized protein (DUF3820 family)